MAKILNWLSSYSIRYARESVLRRTPHVMHLHTMRTGRPNQLPSSTLKSSLNQLHYVGGGVVVYYLDANSISIGCNTQLRDYAILEVGGALTIGSDCVIGAYNWVQASGKVEFGEGVITGPHCSFISTSHQHVEPGASVGETALIRGRVKIGNNVWIGANVSVLMGVTIGDNVTIGSGSVVTHDIPSNTIAYGAPCRVQRAK